MENLLTIKQAASELNLSVSTVRLYCQDGRMGEKVGNVWLITRADLERFKAQRRPPGRPRLDGQTPGRAG